MATWTPTQIAVVSAGLTTATNAYVTGDQLGTEITVTGAASSNAGFGAITGIELVDYSNILGAVDLFLFSDSTTPAADNAAAAWSDADALKSVAGSPVFLPAPVAMTSNRLGGVGNLWIPFKSGAGHANLFADLVTRSGHTFFGAVGDIKLLFSVVQWG